ncbi:SclB protein [Streptococcus pyogenes]|uniref:LPXTG-anchored collagen-like adhesin Scl2/SclB n=1 Tax=Streptococcus pyogenes TaxID=1314 RepID=UPI00109D23F1|nr:LPXTG-anchored collagen-like adhesin Scl2/SclB [Streptococcus pyogenes]VGV24031.1 SclB protein [Streptococcus pyogenes]
MLTFGGASAVKANEQGIREIQQELSELREGFPKVTDSFRDNNLYPQTAVYKHLEALEKSLNKYLSALDKNLHHLKGDQGETGPAGAQGPQGQPGPAGPRGERGDKGETGDKGEQGPAGKDGERGPVGPAGKDGQNGKDGLPGKDGKDGQDGKDGLPGKDGQDGKDGLPGKDGKDGQPGKPAPKTPEVPQKPDTAPHTPKTPQIPGQSKDVTPAPQNPSNRGLNKPQTQGGNQLAKTPAAHDTHRQLPATGETTNPFFTAAAVAIMTTAGVVAVAKRQENN